MTDLKTNLKKALGIKKGNCIPEGKVTCPKEREYLKKEGLLCPVADGKPEPGKIDKKPRKKRKRGLLDEWFA